MAKRWQVVAGCVLLVVPVLGWTGVAGAGFAPAVNLAAGDGPSSVAVADFNGDGRPDVAVTDELSGKVTVVLTGAGTADFGVGSAPRSLAVADFDVDGKPDLAVANSGSANWSLLHNTTAPGATTPSFSTASHFGAGTIPVWVEAADFNGDGRPDVAVANFGSRNVTVDLTDGSAANFVVVGTNPHSVAVADFDGDGRADLAVANFGSNTWSLLVNTTVAGATTPTFVAGGTFGTGTKPVALAAADFNGDGRPDVAVANFGSANLTVQLTGGAAATVAVGGTLRHVAAADLNGDGRPDLAVTDEGSDSVSVRYNSTPPGATTATFAPTAATLAAGDQPYWTAPADMDLDGVVDLVVANRGSDTVSVLGNTASPGAASTSFAPVANFGAGSRTWAVAAGDFNGDGHPDLAAANYTSHDVSVLLNTTPPGATTPAFAAAANFGAGSDPISVAAADLNGDGRPDLAMANNSNVSVLLNTTPPGATAPAFAPAATFGAGAAPVSVAAADLNGDGRLDLAVANLSSGNVSVLLNTTPPGAAIPAFAPAATFGAGAAPVSVAAADLNGDGRLDLAVANLSSDNVSVLLNTTPPGATTPAFAAAANFGVGAYPSSVTAVDLNGDGRPELAVANQSSSGVSVLLNTTSPGATTPAFAAAANVGVGAHPSSVTAVDLNGDGRPDLATANPDWDSVSVLLNTTPLGTTTATFAAAATLVIGGRPASVTAADLNGDGRPDLATARYYSNDVLVLLDNRAPAGSASPEAVPFGSQAVGTTSAAQTVTVANSGRLPLVVTGATFTGADAGDFAVSSSTCDSVDPGGSCKLGVTFTPSATGSRAASLVISDTAAGTPRTVALSGDGLPSLSIADVTVAEGDSGTKAATFTITRSPAASFASSVSWSTADGSAVAPGDYLAVAPTVVSFGPGETTKSVSVTVNGDTAVEANDGFSVKLSDPTGAVIADGVAVGRITNDDTATFSVDDVTVAEGNSATKAATFTITRSGATGGPASLRWATLNGSATAGSDYVGVAATAVSFNPGETTKSVSVTVNGDTAAEADESFFVRLSAPAGATIADATGVGRITNDDTPATFAVNDVTLTEGTSGTKAATFTVTRSGFTTATATVSWSTLDGSATAGSDYVAVPPTTLTFAPGETTKSVSVTVNGDTAYEANEAFFVRLANPTGASIADPTGVGRITNDD